MWYGYHLHLSTPYLQLVFQSQNLALVIVSGNVLLGLCKCRPGLQECGVHPVLELVDSFESGSYLVWFKAHLWVSASVNHERSLLGGRMHMVVVLELC